MTSQEAATQAPPPATPPKNPNLKPCKSCGHEVAKSVKKCPHCGAKLKMGLIPMIILGVIGLVILGQVFGPSKEEKEKAQAAALQNTINSLITRTPDQISAAELASLYALGSNATDLQRENRLKEIKGKLVQWTLPVYEVKKSDEHTYKIQTSSTTNTVGTYSSIIPKNPGDVSRISTLKTGDTVTVRGIIDGTGFMRNFQLNPAVLLP